MAPIQQASTKQDILTYLLRQGQATAQELAEILQVTPQAVRRHLKDLEQEELIEHVALGGGMGRPQHRYTLSRKGRAQFPNRYGEFVVDLLATLHQTLGQERLGQILAHQWQSKAQSYREALGTGDLATRIQRLVQLRRSEGYMAECQATPQGFVVTEHTCAIAAVAETFPRVCDHELELFATALPDCTVERTHWIVNGQHQCGYLIRPQSA
ncbi:MAG: iron-sulfur cluster biosynthesis transcriptional regulator SufR [Gloeomargarita sp. HHBFW_bins_162]